MQSTDEVSEATERKGISCWGLLLVHATQVDERTYIYESVNSSNPSAYAVGDQTTLLVLPADPARARENSFSELWLLPIAMGLGAVFGLGIAIYVPIAISRRNSKTILPVHIQ